MTPDCDRKTSLVENSLSSQQTVELQNAAQAAPIQALFDRIAPIYDQLNDWLSLGQHRIWKQMAVKWSNCQPGDTCLDLCCGSGDLAQRLARQVGPTGRVVGADFSKAQLAIAQQRLEASSCPAIIDWVEADALNLPFSDAQFDAATMGYGLRNVTDIPRSLRELHRVLKPRAKAAILDFHRPANQDFQAFQAWYLNTIVVPLAEQFGLREEYAYLSPSLEKFPIGSEQMYLARQAGFSEATHYPIAGGTMGVLVVTKGSD
ncbi:bifunctional demethylmenaquinone methyltransferase/2-methoxy-6-polyprenyl-1,4-benzoquinol methylase UbiE [Trichocoleus sp. FACHB-262]|uniref:bifunctional demethylmenaquinone methyltransferase/2-methoxy-6-polyprenyl-1,4-benzoquinol methylase UbiE n=1 Tax=Trichocoleus sp. FACHB-262 TaxID=2692869 RepID=UPI0016871C90|nr:bifunctional demethylmenaquinone methyltransferase/2-methoxy-6-polyprenyl-1,4-benzoquinol methylase UbiE [Trichocoleus sp. FACHB-262]MBD2121934.1 bifunctional demethylmenaquinone methyltransferase/2-methoxy-6-polyprenyl-1,4-benzoquinol methylase UbiE [Trichocoleus sp. FACHB-262]